MSAGLADARVALMALACLWLAGCTSAPVPDGYRDYVGHWRGDGVLLVISADGHADYEIVRGGLRTSLEGPVHGFDGREFHIGWGPLASRFEVQEPPRLADGRWRMTVDGHALVRVEILPVQSGRERLRQ